MKRILFSIIILLLFSGIALGHELGAGDGTGYPGVIDTDTSVEVDYPDPLATTARAAVPNDTNAAVIAIETELGINPSGAYDTVKARLDADLYYLKTEIDELSEVETIYTKDIIDSDELASALTLYYLKTTIDTIGEVENIWVKDIIDSDELASLKFIDLSDTPAAYDNGKYAKSTADGVVWDDPAGVSTFIGLTDTPANYTGGSLKFIRVNEGETALEFAEEADPNVDSDAEIKAILVDEVTKTGDFTAGRIAKINNASGIIEQGTNTDTDVADAVTKKHTANADTDLDATFELTFVKKTDTVNVLSDITSAGTDIEDAVTKKHTQNTDTQFDFSHALASDHTWSGDKDTQPVGESVVFGDLLYFDWTDVEWKKTDADAAATMPGLRIALETKADGETCLMLVKGYIRDDSAFEFTLAMVYASATAGGLTTFPPSTPGQQLQRVGVAKSADILFFDPSIDVGEIKL